MTKKQKLFIFLFPVLICSFVMGCRQPDVLQLVHTYHHPTQWIGEKIIIAGNYGFILSVPDNLIILDFSNPLQPTPLSQYTSRGRIESIIIENNVAYLAVRDVGLEVIDVSDPSQPIKIDEYAIGETQAVGLSINDGYAYLWENEGPTGYWHIIDISDPTHVQQINLVEGLV